MPPAHLCRFPRPRPLSVCALGAILLAACGGKIAPSEDDAGLAGTCGAHASSSVGTAPSCRSSDSVVCTSGTYVVACDCAAGLCTCAKDGVATMSVPFDACACAPTRESLLAVYGACEFPY